MDLRWSAGLRGSLRLVVGLLPLAASWLLAVLFPFITSIPGWNPYGGWPEVPFLLSPNAAGGHVQSSVYYFVIVLGGGLLSAAVVEFSKYLLAREIVSPVPYFALLGHQVVIVADVIRSNAWDWWTYLLSVVHLYEIDRWSWRHLHPSLHGRWPWPSAVSALVVAAVVLLIFRNSRAAGEQLREENEVTAGKTSRDIPAARPPA